MTPNTEGLTNTTQDTLLPWTDLLAYVLQDDLHNRLTPRVIDIAYTAFMLAKQPNKEDGGDSDWFNDTKPAIKEAIDKLRADLFADREQRRTPPAEQPAAEGMTDGDSSPTEGMNLGQRIAHVGGRITDKETVEFGSVMAVLALIQHALRDHGFQARYRVSGGEWSSWGHVVCGVKGHEQELRAVVLGMPRVEAHLASKRDGEAVGKVVDSDLMGNPIVRWDEKPSIGTKLYAHPPANHGAEPTAAQHFKCSDDDLHVCHECDGFGVHP